MTGKPEVGRGGRRMPSAADPRHRLATYGTLAPGRPNHHQLDGLEGRWSHGQVRGRLVDAGWGAGFGCTALVLDPKGPAIEVAVFESADLPAQWPRLDDFEGSSQPSVVTAPRRSGLPGL
jgi:gamma-glutamylcyclotransferase (GGCT)/AIG2-like uncharacterized protein YtfP